MSEAPTMSPLGILRRVPLYLQILVALILGVIAGVLVSPIAASRFDVPAQIVLRFLGAIAPPLILVAVMRALITANVQGRLAGKMFYLLVLNTLMAIFIGLLVANVVRPGRHVHLETHAQVHIGGNIGAQLLENIPDSLLRPLVENKVIGVIIIAVVFGIAARRLEPARITQVVAGIEIVFDLILIVLHWVIALVPIAVFCKVTYVVGTKGFKPFVALGWFIVAVIVALILQATWYLLRVRWRSWVRPTHLLSACRDALAMAFSTASSTVTMPVTYAALRERVGLRQESASLGALVGSNFNNDGTALYEAMSALFVAQMLGVELSLFKQIPGGDHQRCR